MQHFPNSNDNFSADLACHLLAQQHRLFSGPMPLLQKSFHNALDILDEQNETQGFLILSPYSQSSPTKSFCSLKIQTGNLSILEQRAEADFPLFAKIMAKYNHIIVWLRPDDFCDNTLNHWLRLWNLWNTQFPLWITYFCPWHTDSSMTDLFTHSHGNDFSTVSLWNTECSLPPVSLDFASLSPNQGLLLSDDFLKKCHKKRSFVFCNNDEIQSEFDEWTHKFHQEASISSPKTLPNDTRDGYSLGVFFNPQNKYQLDILSGWLKNNAPVSVVATDSLSLLNILSWPDTPQEQDFSSPDRNACLEACLQPGNHSLTWCGTQSHVSQLTPLHGYRHKIRATTANSDFGLYIGRDFIRQKIASRFVADSRTWSLQELDLLQGTAILRADASPAPNAWLDSTPLCIPHAQMKRIEDLLWGRTNPQMPLSPDAQKKLDSLRHTFTDLPTPRCIEVGEGIALWWTFAGSWRNQLLCMAITALAPKLRLSFGNFHIRMDWRRSGTDKKPEITRFKMIANQIRDLTLTIPESILPKLFDDWKSAHPYAWIFPQMPDDQVRAMFLRDFSRIQCIFDDNTLPVLDTKQLHCLDPIPIEFEPLTSKPNQTCEKISSCTSETHGSPVIAGIMHTKYPWSVIDTPAALNQAIDIILKQPYIGLDVETTLFDQTLCLIQIGCADRTFLIDPLSVNYRGLAQVFSHPNIIKIIHNASFEQKVLGKSGMQIINIVDTLKVSRKRYGMKAPGGHSLKSVCMREFGLDMDKTNQTSRWEKRPLSSDQLEYAALDAEILIHLYRKFFE